MMRYISMAAAAILALALSTAPLAQEEFTVWRWVDENGVTHYTQSEPQGVEAEQVTLRQARREQARQEARQQSTEQREQPAREHPEDVAERQEAYRQEVEEFCEQARDRLNTLNGPPRILVTPPDGGDPYIMTEEERQAEISRMEQAIAENCGDNGQ